MSPDDRDIGVLACQSSSAVASGLQGSCVGLITGSFRHSRADLAPLDVAFTKARSLSKAGRISVSNGCAGVKEAFGGG